MDASDGKSISLPHSVIVKAPGLLPMHYTAKDLTEELNVSRYMIRQWIQNGLPYHRDTRSHLMIDGRELAEWVQNQRQLKKNSKLKPDRVFCLRCRRVVTIANSKKYIVSGRPMLKGNCELCGAGVSRGISDGKPR